MFEKFTMAEGSNFRQRYQNTYGFFKKKDQQTLVKILEVGAGENSNQMIFVDSNDLKYTLKADSDDPSIGFEFLYPKLGYHNTQSGTYLMRRIVARQYSRGLCQVNTRIESVEGANRPVAFPILLDIFTTKLPAKEAKDKFNSFALSNAFAISVKHQAIMCYGTPIGKVSQKNEGGPLEIKLFEPNLWAVEVNDALRRENIGGNVL